MCCVKRKVKKMKRRHINRSKIQSGENGSMKTKENIPIFRQNALMNGKKAKDKHRLKSISPQEKLIK